LQYAEPCTFGSDGPLAHRIHNLLLRISFSGLRPFGLNWILMRETALLAFRTLPGDALGIQGTMDHYRSYLHHKKTPDFSGAVL
jgi:hypothetical protein